MPEAASCLREFAFQDLEVSVLTADCLVENQKSGRVMEKIGMKKLGQVYLYMKNRGQSELADYYALRRTEFLREK